MPFFCIVVQITGQWRVGQWRLYSTSVPQDRAGWQSWLAAEEGTTLSLLRDKRSMDTSKMYGNFFLPWAHFSVNNGSTLCQRWSADGPKGQGVKENFGFAPELGRHGGGSWSTVFCRTGSWGMVSSQVAPTRSAMANSQEPADPGRGRGKAASQKTNAQTAKHAAKPWPYAHRSVRTWRRCFA